jgi:hypothetical protein
MSEGFASITAIAAIAQTGRQSEAALREIERRLDAIADPIEWFASGMYLESVRQRGAWGVRWAESV